MNRPVFHKVHPLTILVELPRIIRRAFLVLAYAAFQLFKGGVSGDTQAEIWATGIGVIVLVPAALRYLTFSYAVFQGNLLVRSGILTKNLRTIPLDRIQNINISRSLVHRLLGLVDLEIETAVGSKAEASISAVSEETAHVLRAQLTRSQPTTYAPHLAERNRVIVYKPTLKELLLAGASENRAGAILAAVLGLGALQPLIKNLVEQQAPHLIEDPSDLAKTSAWVWFALGFGLFLLFGWLTSIVSTLVKYYNFEITNENGTIRRAYGLFNHFENVVPLKRIQTVHVKQNFVQKWFKISKVFVATAGGFGQSGHSQEGNTQVVTSPLLTPVVRDNAVDDLLLCVMPESKTLPEQGRSVSKRTIFRHVRASIVVSLVIAGALAFFIQWWSVLVFLGLLGVAAGSGVVYYRTTQWLEKDGLVFVRSGWLAKTWSFLPCHKVQAVTVTQSPVQRSLGLASVSMVSAAHAFRNTDIDDIEQAEAFDVGMRAHEVSRNNRDALLDGL